jgi:L-alanine-DL-glutamate epimerase-like enolase superfamily enzyme
LSRSSEIASAAASGWDSGSTAMSGSERSTSREILALCRAAGAQAVVGSQYEGALGAWASVALATGAAGLSDRPAEVGNFLDLAVDLVELPEIVNGRVAVGSEPGLGVVIDSDALACYRMDG